MALALHVLWLGLKPASWTRPVRTVLARQIYFTGAQALRLTGVVAVLVGIAVVLQAQLWLTEVGQTELIGPILVSVIVRELAPLLVCIIVILRSGSAIATELGSMVVHGEVRALQAMGVDPLRYLLLPRMVGLVVSVVCLDVLFTVTAFATGYFASLLSKLQATGPLEFSAGVLASLHLHDVLSPLVKVLAAPLVIGAICCHAGITGGSAPTEVPKAATRALSGSMVALFAISVLVSAVGYAL